MRRCTLPHYRTLHPFSLLTLLLLGKKRLPHWVTATNQGSSAWERSPFCCQSAAQASDVLLFIRATLPPWKELRSAGGIFPTRANPHFTLGGSSYFSWVPAAAAPCSESLCAKSECAIWLTGTWPLMMTSSAKRTLTGLVFNLAFLAALMNADLGDFGEGKGKKKHNAENYRTIT